MKALSGPFARLPVATGGTALILTGTTVAMWLLFDVPVDVVVRYLAYELAFTAAPGILAWHAIVAPAKTGLKDVALGWAFGYVLELVAFVATAAIGIRGAFIAYPILVIGVSLLVLWQRRRSRTWAGRGEPDLTNPSEGHYRVGGAETTGWVWAFGVLVAILLVYVAEGYFTGLPLPGDLTGSVNYYQDFVWQLSLAAEARHHWPLEVPNVAGLKLEYHYFAYLHMAAVNQVTGIDLVTVDLRLYVIPIVVSASLLLVTLGRSLTGSAWAGLIAVFLAFMVGQFDPWPTPPAEFFAGIFWSASYGYGLLFFFPIAILLGDQLRAKRLGRLREWILIGVFAAAAAGAKATILPVVLAALALVGLAAVWWEWGKPLRERLLTARVALGVILIGSIGVLSKLLIFPDQSGELEIGPLVLLKSLYPYRLLADQGVTPRAVNALVLLVFAIPETIKMLAPLLPGLWIVLSRREDRRNIANLWPLALLVVGLVFYYVFFAPGQSQGYFLYYGYVAGAALSAAGLWHFWNTRFGHFHIRPRVALFLAGLILLPWAVDGPPGGEGTPLIYRKLNGVMTWSTKNNNLTPELYRGYRWIRSHTPTDSVLATNNRWQDRAMSDARYFYASAFAERRVVLEGDYGTPFSGQFATAKQLRRDPSTGPYGERARLIQSIFVQADPAAVRAARKKYGVDYLVLDLVHKGAARPARVASLGDVIYRNPAMILVDVRRPRS